MARGWRPMLLVGALGALPACGDEEMFIRVQLPGVEIEVGATGGENEHEELDDAYARGATCEGFDWAPGAFAHPDDALACAGPQLVRFEPRLGLFVGLVLCSASEVRVYLSEKGTGVFLPALDLAGHGQDHCELVNPQFSLASEDDITSGGCQDCATSANLPLEGQAGYVRARLGEPFAFVPATPPWTMQTSRLACGVDLGGCANPDDVALE